MTVVTPEAVTNPNQVTAGMSAVEENLVASHCAKYRTGACPHPHPDCIVPTNPCPKTCGDFQPIEQESRKDDGLARGAADILNGTSGRREP